MQTVARSLLLLTAALLPGLFTLAPTAYADEPSLVEQIRSFPSPGESEWDAQVSEVMLRAYDSNQSGAINTPKELKMVPCAVLVAIDDALRSRNDGYNLVAIYGVSKDYLWVGYVLGFDEKIRKKLAKKAQLCGLVEE